jgi:2-polyprenyl-3-methyl-5-hydroxy-6-metoxy-1,4-benzoquinol methylase
VEKKNMHDDQQKIDQNEVEFFDNYYDEEHYNPVGWRLRIKREIRIISKIAQSNNKNFGRVLSLGCGDGQLEIMLAPFTEEIIGIDLSPEAIKIAEKSADEAGIKNVRFECASVNNVQWKEKFDTVLAIAFFHHIPDADLPDLIKQLHNCLQTGGFLYSSDPNEKALLRKIGRILMGKKYDNFHSPDEHEMNPIQVSKTVRDAGFNSVTITWTDFTLIPALFILKNGPNWPLYMAKWLDDFLYFTPLRPLASAFSLSAIKDK